MSKDYQVCEEVTKIASELNNKCLKLEKLLADTSIGTIVVENRDTHCRARHLFKEGCARPKPTR